MNRCAFFMAFAITALLCPAISQAQYEPCASDMLMDRLYQQHPELEKEAMSNFLGIRAHEKTGLAAKTTANKIIPVVVHVVYNINQSPAQVIPYAVVKDQIRVLNNDFKRLNADTVDTPIIFLPIAGATDFEFRLALVDPQGNPTDGVTYTPTTTVFGGSGEFRMKFDSTGGIDAWDVSKYMNIWVSNLNQPGIAGFTYLAESAPFVGNLDGVVIKYNSFGGVGRVATHQVGHYFGLRHTFDGSPCDGSSAGTCYVSGDRICDTPPVSGPGYGKCAPTVYNSCTETPIDLPDNISNYMDYSNGICQDMFTQQQVALMEGVTNGIRQSLVTNNSGIVGPATLKGRDAAIFDLLSPDASFCQAPARVIFRMRNYGTDTLTSAVISYSFDGNTPSSHIFSGMLLPNALITVTLPGAPLSIGNHSLMLSIDTVNGQPDENPANSQKTFSFTVGNFPIAPLSLTEGFECVTGAVPAGWSQTATSNGQWVLANVGGFGQSGLSIKRRFDMDQSSDAALTRLTTPLVDLGTVQNDPSARLYIKYSFAYVVSANAVSDELRIRLIADCGNTDTLLLTRKGFGTDNLATASPSRYVPGTVYIPTAVEWQTDSIEVTDFIGRQFVSIAFETKSNKRSTLYLDDLQVVSNKDSLINPCSAVSNEAMRYKIFPNPVSYASGVFRVELQETMQGSMTVQLFDLLGHEVASFPQVGLGSREKFEFKVPSLSSGIYYVRLSVDGRRPTTQKIIVSY